MVVTGDRLARQLHVDGKVTGTALRSLSQGESGAIAGNIDAEEARLAGLIDGAVSAGTLLLEATARITGDVLYGTLTVATGAQVDGRFKHRDGESDGSLKARTADLPTVTKPAQPVAAAPTGLFAGPAAEPTPKRRNKGLGSDPGGQPLLADRPTSCRTRMEQAAGDERRDHQARLSVAA